MPNFTHGRKADVLVNQYNLTRFFKTAPTKVEAEVLDGTCFGAESKEYGLGFTGGQCSLEGLFKAIDPLVVGAEEVLQAAIDPDADASIVSIGLAGIDAVGDIVKMFQANEQQHDVITSIQSLVMITAQFLASEGIRSGKALAPIANYSTTGNGTALDNTAATTNGAVAHLHVTAADGTSPTIDWKVQHSVDNSTWVDLITFTQATDITVERLSASGTVNRYLRAVRTVGGTQAHQTLTALSQLLACNSLNLSLTTLWSSHHMPNFVHGRKTVFKLDDSGGTLRDLSTYVNQASLQRLLDLLDTTCSGATAKTYITGFADAKIPFGGFWDPTLDGYLAGAFDALAAGTSTSLSFELYPEGTATGKVKYSGEAVITNYEITPGAQQATAWTSELQVTGSVTRALVS